MKWQFRGPLLVCAKGSSLRKRVAYSLALVRLILVPVLLLAIYYLFRMGWIVDRIVNVDEPAATLAEQASLEMLQARRSERAYFLLQDDPVSLQANMESVARVRQYLEQIRDLEPQEQDSTQSALYAVALYQQRFASATSHPDDGRQTPSERVQGVVRAYQEHLNELLRNSKHQGRSQIEDELRNEVGSFDSDLAGAIQTVSPEMQRVAGDLQNASDIVLKATAALENRNSARVESDHAEARFLMRRAEWVLSIVSAFTILLSVWISFILPREVVQPLVSLKEAVDHAAGGNFGIEFDIQGEGEVVQLANSVRNLIAHVKEKLWT